MNLLVVFNNLKYVTLDQSCNLIGNLKLCLYIDKTHGLSYYCVGFHSSYVTFCYLERKKKQFWGKISWSYSDWFAFFGFTYLSDIFQYGQLKNPVRNTTSFVYFQILMSCFWGWFIWSACTMFWVLVVCLGFSLVFFVGLEVFFPFFLPFFFLIIASHFLENSLLWFLKLLYMPFI